MDIDELYRNDFLSAFSLTEFDEDVIVQTTKELYEKLVARDEMRECMRLSANMFVTEDLFIGFMGLFSFDTFHVLHPCICEYISSGLIKIETINALRNEIVI
jgi:hypothetical protein